MTARIINFHFARTEQVIVLTKAIEGQQLMKAPHAVKAMTHIFEKIQTYVKAPLNTADFKKFTATLTCPPESESTDFSLKIKIVCEDQLVKIRLKLKKDTAESLTHELTILDTPNDHSTAAAVTHQHTIQDANEDESTPLLNHTPELSPAPIQGTWITDILSRLMSGLSSLLSIFICTNSSGRKVTENEPATQASKVVSVAEVKYLGGIRILPDQDNTSFINSIIQAIVHAPERVREALLDAHREEETNIGAQIQEFEIAIESLQTEISQYQKELNDITQGKWAFQYFFDTNYRNLKRQIDANSAKIVRLQDKKNPLQANRMASQTFVTAILSYHDTSELNLKALRGFIERSNTGFEEDAGKLLDAIFSAVSDEAKENYAIRLDIPKEGHVKLQDFFDEPTQDISEPLEKDASESPDWVVVKLNRFPRGKNGPKFETSVELPKNSLLKIGTDTYEIQTLVLHTGNAVSGDYYDYIRKGNVWYKVKDDEPITELKEFPDNTSNRVYLIFLKKLS